MVEFRPIAGLIPLFMVLSRIVSRLDILSSLRSNHIAVLSWAPVMAGGTPCSGPIPDSACPSHLRACPLSSSARCPLPPPLRSFLFAHTITRRQGVRSFMARAPP